MADVIVIIKKTWPTGSRCLSFFGFEIGLAGVVAIFDVKNAKTNPNIAAMGVDNSIGAMEGKEVRIFNGKPHILEEALSADFAIVKAWKGDTEGNLIFKATARNFNPMMAMAGKITIAEVEELVPAGELDPNFIHTPGIFVQRIFKGEKFEKRIEQRTTRKKV